MVPAGLHSPAMPPDGHAHDAADNRAALDVPVSRDWQHLWSHGITVVAAMVLLAAAAGAQRFVAMPRWSAILGRPAEVPDAWRASPVISPPLCSQSSVEIRVARAVRSAARRVPWTPRCLAEATAAQVMLRAAGSPGVVVIGLRPPPGSASSSEPPPTWEAHAWLVGRSGVVTGGGAARGFTPTTVFEVPGGLTACDAAARNPTRNQPRSGPADPSG